MSIDLADLSMTTPHVRAVYKCVYSDIMIDIMVDPAYKHHDCMSTQFCMTDLRLRFGLRWCAFSFRAVVGSLRCCSIHFMIAGRSYVSPAVHANRAQTACCHPVLDNKLTSTLPLASVMGLGLVEGHS